MFPAFRIKGLWPKPSGSRRTDGTHPVTGAQLPKFQSTEAILQFPRNKYDELVAGHPEYRLRYLDEDKEEITIGSEIELAQRLEEPTTHSRLIKLAEDPKFYTAIPECMHVFHVDEDKEIKKLWLFFATGTLTRNRSAYRLWTSPRLHSDEEILALLKEHAYEFMTGYSFEGFNSHYNYLSVAGKRLGEIAGKQVITETPDTPDIPIPTPKASMDTVVSGADSMDSMDIPSPTVATAGSDRQDLQSFHEDEAPKSAPTIPSNTQIMYDLNKLQRQIDKRLSEAHFTKRQLDRLSAASKKSKPASVEFRHSHPPRPSVSPNAFAEKIAALNKQLDEQLLTAQNMTKTLDSFETFGKAFSGNDTLQGRFDRQLQRAKRASQVLETMRQKHGQQLESAQASNRQHMVVPDITEVGDKDTADAHTEQMPSQDKFLTEEGRKASQDAGVKLREQLNGVPKPHHGASKDDVLRWVAYSRDPPSPPQFSSHIFGQAMGNLTGNPTRKKSVRFATDMPSETSTGFTSTTEISKASAENEAFQVSPVSQETTASRMPTDDKDKIAQLSSQDMMKIKALLRAFDRQQENTVADLAERYKRYSKPQAESSGLQIQTEKTPEVSSPTESGKQEAKRPVENAETTLAKLWCQALEGIVGNVQTFAGQLEIHVQPQIDREETALNQELRSRDMDQTFEGDETFLDKSRNMQDLIRLRDIVQRTISDLRSWGNTTQGLLDTPDMISGIDLDMHRLQSTPDTLEGMIDCMKRSMESVFNTFVLGSQPGDSTLQDSQQNSYTLGHYQDRHWKPRRFASVESGPTAPANSRSESSVPQLEAVRCVANDPTTYESYPTHNEPPAMNWYSMDSQTQTQALMQNSMPNTELLESFPPLIPSNSSTWLPPCMQTEFVPSQVNAIYSEPISESSLNTNAATHDMGLHSTGPPRLWRFETAGKQRWNPYRTGVDRTTAAAASDVIRPQTANWPSVSRSNHNSSSSKPTGSKTAKYQPAATHSQKGSLTTQADRPSELTEELPTVANSFGVGSEDDLLSADNTSEGVMRTVSSTADSSSRSNSANLDLLGSIPEHADPKTASKIATCVKLLKSLGYGSVLEGGDARLVVYAQAAKGDLAAALDIIDEEQMVYRQGQGHGQGPAADLL